jgi:hypothetical protein
MPYPGDDLSPGAGPYPGDDDAPPGTPGPAAPAAPLPAEPALSILPTVLVAPVAVGAATRAVATVQRWPHGAVDLAVRGVRDRARQPLAGAPVDVSAFTTSGAPVAALQQLPLPPEPDVPGGYLATVPYGTLPDGRYRLRAVVYRDDPLRRQDLTFDVDVAEYRGVSGLAAPVRTALAPPRLTVSAEVLTFAADQGGPAPPPQRLTLGLTPSGTAPGTRTVAVLGPAGQAAPAWLAAALDGPDVVVTVTPGALGAGGYAAVVRASDPVADNSPVDVAVVLTVAGQPVEGPEPSATPGALAFTATQGGANPAAQTFALANVPAGAVLTVAGVGGQAAPAWLGASRAGNTVTVTVTLGGLVSGSYAGGVRVTSGADVLEIPVALAVAAAAPVVPYYGALTAAEPALTLQQPPGPAVRRPLVAVEPPGGVLVLQLAVGGGITVSAGDLAALAALAVGEAVTITASAAGPVTAVSLTPGVCTVDAIDLPAGDLTALASLEAGEVVTITASAPGPVTAVSLTPAVVEIVA